MFLSVYILSPSSDPFHRHFRISRETQTALGPPSTRLPMTLLPAAVAIVIVALLGASLALAAFFWALRTKQFSVKQMNEGAYVIFDCGDEVGTPTDQMFKKPHPSADERIPD